MPEVQKLSIEKLTELGLSSTQAQDAFSHPLSVQNLLEPAEAKEYILSFGVDWNKFPLVSHDASLMMDADPYVFHNRGVLVCSGGKFDSLVLNSLARPLIVDGDLIVEGTLQNKTMLIVTGNLRSSIITNEANYLIVLGDLKTKGLIGLDEQYGTYIAGHAEIEEAAFVWNHHMGVVGNFQCKHQLNDYEFDRLEELLSSWHKDIE